MIFPASNLSTAAQPWGRAVEKSINNLETLTSTEKINNAARDKQLASSLGRISTIVDSVFVPGTTSINGYNIKAGTVAASSISAGTFQTSDTGQRVVMSDLDQIRFYDSGGILSLVMEGTAAIGDGAFAMYSRSLVGNTGAGFPGSSIYITDTYSSIQSYSSSGAGSGLYFESNGEMYGGGETSTTFTTTSFVINASGSIDLNGLIVSSTGGLGDISVNSLYSSNQINADGAVFGTSISAKNNGGFYGGFTSLSGQMSSASVSTGSVSCSSVSSSGSVSGSSINGSTITTSGSLIRSSLAGGGTTGATIANDGSIVRTSSSARYKRNIKDVSYLYEDILSLSPKSFQLNAEADEDPNSRRYAGFIAEEIAGTSLDIFVAYETLPDGSKRPDGVYYAELTSALLSAIKHQDSTIKDLSARLTVLENK